MRLILIKLILLHSLLAQAICGELAQENEIAESKHPSIVAVEAYQQKCTAVIVGTHALLTAAHCFSGSGMGVNDRGEIRLKSVSIIDPILVAETPFKSDAHFYYSEHYFWGDKENKIPSYADKPDPEHAKGDLLLIKTKENIIEAYQNHNKGIGISSLIQPEAELSEYLVANRGEQTLNLGSKKRGKTYLRELPVKVTERAEEILLAKSLNPHLYNCSGDSGGALFAKVADKLQLLGILSAARGPKKDAKGKVIETKEEQILNSFSVLVDLRRNLDWILPMLEQTEDWN